MHVCVCQRRSLTALRFHCNLQLLSNHLSCAGPCADVAKGKAATQRVFTIIDREPLIDTTSQVRAWPLDTSRSAFLR